MKNYERNTVRTLITAATLSGLFLLARNRAGSSQPPPPPPLTARQYHDWLAHQLEVTLSYGNKPMWDEVSEKCRRAGREDLPGLMRKRRPDWAERIDRA